MIIGLTNTIISFKISPSRHDPLGVLEIPILNRFGDGRKKQMVSRPLSSGPAL